MGVGHEYQGKRPAIIIQANKQIKTASLITIMPVTSQLKKHRDDILISKNDRNNLLYDSLIKVNEIQSFDIANRFIKKIGAIDKAVMDKI